jgi:hypothetical protein
VTCRRVGGRRACDLADRSTPCGADILKMRSFRVRPTRSRGWRADRRAQSSLRSDSHRRAPVLCGDVVIEMGIDQRDNDKLGRTRADRIARRAHDAGEAAAQRAVAARRRGEAARKRVAELRESDGHSPCRSREAANRAGNAAAAAQAAGKRATRAYKRAAVAHEDAADAHDHAADAAERAGDMTHALEHRQAAARDRSAACDDLSRSQRTTSARSALDP